MKYHKINAPFERSKDGPDKGKLISGAWCRQEFGALASSHIWLFTEKLDGTNIRLEWGHGWLESFPPAAEFTIRGRNEESQIPPRLMDALRALRPQVCRGLAGLFEYPTSVTIFGEGIGPNIQKGGHLYEGGVHDFVAFDVAVNGRYQDRDRMIQITDACGLKRARVVGSGTLYDAMNLVTEGLASAHGDRMAEGIVARTMPDLYARDGSRVITKIRANDFPRGGPLWPKM